MRAGARSFAASRQTQALYRFFPSAGFAKYTRDKPHLNVGTIGKFKLSFINPASKKV